MSSDDYLAYIRNPFRAGPGIYTARAYALLATQDQLWQGQGLSSPPPSHKSTDNDAASGIYWTRSRATSVAPSSSPKSKRRRTTTTSSSSDEESPDDESDYGTTVSPKRKYPTKPIARDESPTVIASSPPRRHTAARRSPPGTLRRSSQISSRRKFITSKQNTFSKIEIPVSRGRRDSIVLPTFSSPTATAKTPKLKRNYPDPRLFLKSSDPRLVSEDDEDDEL